GALQNRANITNGTSCSSESNPLTPTRNRPLTPFRNTAYAPSPKGHGALAKRAPLSAAIPELSRHHVSRPRSAIQTAGVPYGDPSRMKIGDVTDASNRADEGDQSANRHPSGTVSLRTPMVASFLADSLPHDAALGLTLPASHGSSSRKYFLV